MDPWIHRPAAGAAARAAAAAAVAAVGAAASAAAVCTSHGNVGGREVYVRNKDGSDFDDFGAQRELKFEYFLNERSE